MGQELNNLPADLQLAQVTMQVNPVQALQIERNVPLQHVVDRDRHRPLEPGRHDTLPHLAYGQSLHLPRGNACGTTNLGGIRRSLPGSPIRSAFGICPR